MSCLLQNKPKVQKMSKNKLSFKMLQKYSFSILILNSDKSLSIKLKLVYNFVRFSFFHQRGYIYWHRHLNTRQVLLTQLKNWIWMFEWLGHLNTGRLTFPQFKYWVYNLNMLLTRSKYWVWLLGWHERLNTGQQSFLQSKYWVYWLWVFGWQERLNTRRRFLITLTGIINITDKYRTLK